MHQGVDCGMLVTAGSPRWLQWVVKGDWLPKEEFLQPSGYGEEQRMSGLPTLCIVVYLVFFIFIFFFPPLDGIFKALLLNFPVFFTKWKKSSPSYLTN